MKTSAFCPSYVTGLFTIGENDAAGAGFAIDLGTTTTVEKKEHGTTKVFINSKEAPAMVSRAVLRRFAEKTGKIGTLDVKHETKIPIGYGMGTSAAGALSLSLALNELFGAGLPREDCVKIAHDADVECHTGLSGVDACAIGGLLARKSVKDGVTKLPFVEKEIDIACYSPIRNSTVIGSPEWKKKVNKAGENALHTLFANLHWEGLLYSSRHFAAEAGLADWCREEMKTNPRASMAMLGHTLFSDASLNLAKPPIFRLKAKTYQTGARLL